MKVHAVTFGHDSIYFFERILYKFHRRMEDMRVSAIKAKRKVQRSIHKENGGREDTSFDWGPVAVTMDLWSFHFIVKSIDRYVDLKDWVCDRCCSCWAKRNDSCA